MLHVIIYIGVISCLDFFHWLSSRLHGMLWNLNDFLLTESWEDLYKISAIAFLKLQMVLVFSFYYTIFGNELHVHTSSNKHLANAMYEIILDIRK